MYYRGGRNGVLIWKKIESRAILDGMSWMSMKGRFLKHFCVIRKNRDSYDILTEEQKIWLRER